MTYEEILERMLSRVPSTFDKREGSVIFDAIAPAAYELSLLYQDYETKLKNTFAGSADRENLIKRCSEIGISPMEATYSVRTMLTTPETLEISIGERFSFEDLNFIVTEKVEDGVYYIQSETAGVEGNFGTGNLIPINYIDGLETATLSDEIIIYGEDEEGTEELRQRYFATLPTMTLDGNVAQYSKWCRTFEGIGNYKIFPLWNGKNTVKVSILSSENTVASQKLISDFQKYLDPADETINDTVTAENYPQGRGMGMGIAPIGAIVTVTTASELAINIAATVVFKEGYSEAVGLQDSINEYLHSINYNNNLVSYVAISALFQNNPCISLVVDITINGAKTNITLGNEQIAKIGTFTVNEGEGNG